MIRVLLVEDHHAFREPLAFMLDLESDIAVVAQAASLAEARRYLPNCDIAVVDIDLPDGSGVDIICELKRSHPCCKTLVLTGSATRKALAQAVEAGASGLLSKAAHVHEIITAVRDLAAGKTLLAVRDLSALLQVAHQEGTRERNEKARLIQLTPREREVLQALADGLNDQDIATRFTLSHQTVRTHMMNILRKLEVDSRLQVLIFAIRHGVVTIE